MEAMHHPEYRSKYAENLKRELPRIPLAKDFYGFSKAGRELARLHIEYESLQPYPLKFIETSSGVLGADVAASLPRHSGVKPPIGIGGKPRGSSPPTPPYMRVRIRRFGELSDYRTVNLGIPSESK